ncbi:MAG: YkvA family protein [Rudaea sp.]
MALEFNIEISDQDLPYFMDAMKRAEERASGKSAQQILDEASKTFVDANKQQMPEFVRSRLACVENLIAMAGDEGWALSDEDRNRVVGAMTYFADPEDLIPDNIPVLGFLDDAIMIEVVQEVLQPEIQAYAEFCDYRAEEAAHRGADGAKVGREDWLEDRRAELHARMRARRTSYAPAAAWSSHFKFS